ncbi:MAG: type II toxin-antitoxin system RelE/ParE family toxin [Steroidobacteraceae bacterium]
MAFEVVITDDAERDLEDIVIYIAQHDSPRSADHVLNRVLDAANSLSVEPTRGSVPKELRELGVLEFRQLFFRPYRLIYRVVDERVVIYLIADGRRDMQTVLAKRMLGH